MERTMDSKYKGIRSTADAIHHIVEVRRQCCDKLALAIVLRDEKECIELNELIDKCEEYLVESIKENQ